MSDRLNIGIPDEVGEVIGWRAWRIVRHPRKDVVRLQSCIYETVWPTSTWCRAECRVGRVHPQGIPDPDCSCGLYAARDKEHLLTMSYPRYNEEADLENANPIVIGQVAYSGRVIAGSLGWRAEKGRILKIEVPHVFADLATPLETLYGIEVKIANTLESVSPVAEAARQALLRRELLKAEGEGDEEEGGE